MFHVEHSLVNAWPKPPYEYAQNTESRKKYAAFNKKFSTESPISSRFTLLAVK